MHLSCCGISHRTALLEMRERFQITPTELTAATEAYKNIAGAEEAVVLASCNRMEFYSVANKRSDPRVAIAEFYRRRGLAFPEEYTELFFVRHGSSAARHLFKVASGLDSLVMGESQIVAQVKDAYGAACACGGPGPLLHKLFHKAFHTSKVVRSETTISDGVTGLAGAAVEVAREKLLGRDAGFNVLLIGVNSSTEIILSRIARATESLTIINRTVSKAERLVRSFGGRARGLDELPEAAAEADVIFSATSSHGFILKPEMLASRSERPLLIFDIAVPRDVDPRASSIPGVTLTDLDDLKHHLALVSKQRVTDQSYALQLVEEQVSEFETWRLSTAGSDAALRALIERDRQAVIDKFRDSFATKEYKALDAFSRQLCRQLMRRLASSVKRPKGASEDD